MAGSMPVGSGYPKVPSNRAPIPRGAARRGRTHRVIQRKSYVRSCHQRQFTARESKDPRQSSCHSAPYRQTWTRCSRLQFSHAAAIVRVLETDSH